MLSAKNFVRGLVYGWFPELSLDSGALSWPGAVLDRLSLASERVSALVTLSQGAQNQKRRGTVVLLPPADFAGPRFISVMVAATGRVTAFGSPSETCTAQFPMHWPLPAGGWIVSHGCSLVDVFVGNQHQSQVPGADFCQLTNEASPGMQLQARVRFDD